MVKGITFTYARLVECRISAAKAIEGVGPTKKAEGRSVIGVGAPFDAQASRPGVPGVEIRSQTSSKLTNLLAYLNTRAGKKLRPCSKQSVLLFELFLKAIFQFGADVGDFHSCAHQEFAA